MISNISSWAEQVVIAVIIGTIIEMLLPKAGNYKYIKTVIGIYILYTIISPIISLASSGFSLDLDEYEEYFETGNLMNIDDSSVIEDTYKEELTKKIIEDIESEGFTVSYIDLEFNIETGEIEYIALNITKEENDETDDIDINIEINNIYIGNTIDESYENTLSKQEIDKLKEMLEKDYGISYENIIINSI